MSDNESSASDQTEKSVDQESSSPDRDDPPSDSQIDRSTDVAPVRKTRRRPEHKPPPEDQKTPETPPQAETASNVSFCHSFINIWMTIPILLKGIVDTKIQILSSFRLTNIQKPHECIWPVQMSIIYKKNNNNNRISSLYKRCFYIRVIVFL